jgi:hypothetical protein
VSFANTRPAEFRTRLLQFPSTFADLVDVQAIELSVVFGLPGLLLGLAIGVAVRQWPALALIAVCAAVAVRYGTRHFLSGQGDNDPRIIWGIALVANFIGLLIGAAAARLLSGLRRE